MKKRFIVVFLAMLLCLCAFCGCNDETIQQPTGLATTTAPITVTTKPLLDKEVGILISKDELSEAVGIPMQEPDVTEQGSGLTSFSEESDKSRVVVDIAKADKTIFETRVLPAYTDLEACPNLGESAWFSPAFNHLLVYNNGYMMTVELVLEGTNNANENRQRCRQIASIILERL